jgi:hypothetical protein
MPRTAARRRTDSLALLRRAHRGLEQELADYATAAERDDLAALIDGRGAGDSLAAEILSRQARVELFRAG